MPLERITLLCFAASYAVALLLEIAHLLWPSPVIRVLRSGFAAAGLLAQTLYLLVHWPPLETPFGSLLFLAWVLAVFAFSGSLHYRQFAWGVFVLPLVCGLVGMAALLPNPSSDASVGISRPPVGLGPWGQVHGVLLLLAAVGVCIAFLASVVYLFHAYLLGAKVLPRQGRKLFSLERLEAMNRSALNLAFPLLTLGACLGIGLLVEGYDSLASWADPKLVSTVLLWLVLALLLYLRYGAHLGGRRLALLTVLAFALLLVTLASSHDLAPGGGP
jgi:ABC-type transport system involved in cytochrome c biogenesis permease subunit